MPEHLDDRFEFSPQRKHQLVSKSVMPIAEPPSEFLFSYGTLQLEAVQLATFGRRLEGTADALPGFVRSMVRIDDPAVVETSGESLHPIVAFTGQSSDIVQGTVFAINQEELQRADAYEVGAYKRISVVLLSGMRAWVYVDLHHAPPDS
jgi:Gamma-glutamyl cyclotransferase, AIG2-like